MNWWQTWVAAWGGEAWAAYAAIALVLLVGLVVAAAIDPCAEYVSVPEQAHTVDGTPVTVSVRKCLRMKEGWRP